MTSSPSDPIAVVGAGLAGLLCARQLHEHGLDVRVFDKGRGPGGRSCTRRTPAGRVDFGAQYFTCRSAELSPWLERWLAAGVAAPWPARIVVLDQGGQRDETAAPVRYVGVPGMSSLAQDLAAGLDVQLQARVLALHRQGNGWLLQLEDGRREGPFSRLGLGLPTPSVAALLHGCSPLAAQAASVTMDPCWALLVGFAQPVACDFDAAFVSNAALRWLARDSSKPGRPGGDVWVLHAGPAFSRAELTSPPERISRLLLADFAGALGRALPEPTFCIAHRWGYASIPAPLERGCLVEPAQKLAVGGDWCQGSRVEGALRSGLAMARALTSFC